MRRPEDLFKKEERLQQNEKKREKSFMVLSEIMSNIKANKPVSSRIKKKAFTIIPEKEKIQPLETALNKLWKEKKVESLCCSILYSSDSERFEGSRKYTGSWWG